MVQVCIKNFSCIENAKIELSKFTLLIGPQASGKSVISKLIHFFSEKINITSNNDYIYRAENDLDSLNLENFKTGLISSFRESFPPQTWGKKAFEIEFITGPIIIRIFRSTPRKEYSDLVKITLSEYLENIIEKFFDQIRTTRKELDKLETGSRFRHSIELQWKIERSFYKKLEEDLGADFIRDQLFVPAGRSFFTNIGKTIVAFEQGLDSTTLSFGRHFLSAKEELSGRGMAYRSYRKEKSDKAVLEYTEKLFDKFFDGKIKEEKNDVFIESNDGRKIPLSILSSGQQELLPLWLMINDFYDKPVPNSLVYVEEPEAHLFPSAQGLVMEFLSTMLNIHQHQRMLITTHSPYILSKLNVLLKAGSLSLQASKKQYSEIEKIVPKSAWLTPKEVSAYAIIDKKVISIIDEDYLLNGEYLDGVSEEISSAFSKLLDIEYPE